MYACPCHLEAGLVYWRQTGGEDMQDNYAKLADDWRVRFLQTDIAKKAGRLGLTLEDGAFEICYFGTRYRVDCHNGAVENLSEPGKAVPWGHAAFIYHLFWFSTDMPRLSGIFVPFRDVRGAAVFDSAFKRSVLEPLARTFEGRAARLERACVALGGRRIPQGDVGFALPVYGKLEVEILFWDADEEFCAAANILFDRNVTDFTHVETVVGIGSDALRALKAAAGLN